MTAPYVIKRTIPRKVIPIRKADETPEEKAQRIRDIRKAVTGTEDVPYESESVETINRYKAKVRNPLTGIRAHCVECSGGSLKEVAECPVVKCALHPFRMGTNMFHKKTRDRLGLNDSLAEESGTDDNTEGEDDGQADE